MEYLAEVWRDIKLSENVRFLWRVMYGPVRVALYVLIMAASVFLLCGVLVAWPLSKIGDWLWERFPKKGFRSIFLKGEG